MPAPPSGWELLPMLLLSIGGCSKTDPPMNGTRCGEESFAKSHHALFRYEPLDNTGGEGGGWCCGARVGSGRQPVRSVREGGRKLALGGPGASGVAHFLSLGRQGFGNQGLGQVHYARAPGRPAVWIAPTLLVLLGWSAGEVAVPLALEGWGTPQPGRGEGGKAAPLLHASALGGPRRTAALPLLHWRRLIHGEAGKFHRHVS